MTIFARIRNGLSQKIVIDWSMTILKQPSKDVVDRSMTIFACIRMGYHRKLSLTGQWQFWCSFLRMSLTGQLQFLLPLGMGYHRKLSLTGQWQFSGSPVQFWAAEEWHVVCELLSAESAATWLHQPQHAGPTPLLDRVLPSCRCFPTSG